MINKNIYSNLAIPPGEYLEEVITELGISVEELARQTSLKLSTLIAILKGNHVITPEIAMALNKVTGISERILVGLEKEYHLILIQNI